MVKCAQQPSPVGLQLSVAFVLASGIAAYMPLPDRGRLN